MYQHTSNAIEFSLLERSRAHFEMIVLTRRWAAEHGGVYVLKRSGVESNPFLPDSDIEAKDGQVLALRNPALMTREISEYAKEDANYLFHITSDIPLNPNNQPDDWERMAIERFQSGTEEYYGKERSDGKTYFRYMAPL